MASNRIIISKRGNRGDFHVAIYMPCCKLTQKADAPYPKMLVVDLYVVSEKAEAPCQGKYVKQTEVVFKHPPFSLQDTDDQSSCLSLEIHGMEPKSHTSVMNALDVLSI